MALASDIIVGSIVRFIDEDGAGDPDARNGDVGVVIEKDGGSGLSIALTNRPGTIFVLSRRVEVVEREETTLDEAVKQCKNLKTEIQQLQLELNKYENILFKAGVKLI